MKNTVLVIALVAICSCALAQADKDTMVAHYIDMGQGAATILEFSCGVILIDGGAQNPPGASPSQKKVMDYLKTFFARRTDLHETIDAIIITHNHHDHVGSLKAISDAYTVKNIVTTTFYMKKAVAGTTPQKEQDYIRYVTRNEKKIKASYLTYSSVLKSLPNGVTSLVIDPLDCSPNEPTITIYTGSFSKSEGQKKLGKDDRGNYEYDDPNNHSLAIKVKYGKSTLFFTGDMEQPAIKYMLDKYKGHESVFDADVYQAGHHGSTNAFTPELLTAISPKYVVISASHSDDHTMSSGYDYGHPNKDVVNHFSNAVVSGRKGGSIHGDVYTKGWDDKTKLNSTIEKLEVKNNVYCTCWDGTVKMAIDLDGNIRVE
jgi:competence protein ComEC